MVVYVLRACGVILYILLLQAAAILGESSPLGLAPTAHGNGLFAAAGHQRVALLL